MHEVFVKAWPPMLASLPACRCPCEAGLYRQVLNQQQTLRKPLAPAQAQRSTEERMMQGLFLLKNKPSAGEVR